MRVLRLGWMVAVVMFCASCQTSGMDPVDATPRAAFDRFIAAFNALDWEAFRRCFADSASLFNPDIPDAISLHRIDGRQDVERSFRTVFDASAAGADGQRGPNVHPENVRLQQFGDTAVVTFEFVRSEHSIGRRTIVFNKLQGAWLIVHIHASNVAPR